MKLESRICEWKVWGPIQGKIGLSYEILCVDCAKKLKEIGLIVELNRRRTLKACQGCGKWLRRTDGVIEVIMPRLKLL